MSLKSWRVTRMSFEPESLDGGGVELVDGDVLPVEEGVEDFEGG
jgi:hypothetical protein